MTDGLTWTCSAKVIGTFGSLPFRYGRRQVGRKLEAEAQVALAPAEDGQVDRQRERGVAELARFGDVIERALLVSQHVQLEPARRRAGRFRDLVVRARRGRRHAHQGPGSGCGACRRDLALRIEEALKREWRDKQRHRDRRSEDRRRGRDLADVDEHAGPEPPAPVGSRRWREASPRRRSRLRRSTRPVGSTFSAARSK